MTALHYYRNNDGDMEQVAVVLRWDYTGSEKAEEGGAGTWEVYVDDPDMTLDFVGHRRWIIYEDDSDDENEVLVDGLTQAVRISHKGGSVTAPLGRVWTIEIADLNTLFQYRVMIGSDSQRPEETDVERVTAIAELEEMGYFDNLTFIAAGSPVDMEEDNVRGQFTGQVIDGCAQDTGKNWYIFSEGDHVSGTDIALWYGKDSLITRTSPLSLSNDPADLDWPAIDAGSATTYAIGADTELRRDYGRQYSGAFGTFQGGAKYLEDAVTAAQITGSGRDIVHPAPEIRSRERMKRRLLRVLRDHRTPDEVIKTTVVLPANKASQLRPGMRVSTRATHEPGYETARFLRVLSAAPKPIGRKAGVDVYSVALELQGPGAMTEECEVQSFNYLTGTLDGSVITGNTPSGSYPPHSVFGLTGNDLTYGIEEGLSKYTGSGGGAGWFGARPYPHPAYPTFASAIGGGWSFRNYNVADGTMPFGVKDGGTVVGANDKLQLLVVGAGTMTAWATSVGTGGYRIYGVDVPDPTDAGDDVLTLIDTGSLSFPSTQIVVPDAGYCLYSIIIVDNSGDGASLFWGGWDWEAD